MTHTPEERKLIEHEMKVQIKKTIRALKEQLARVAPDRSQEAEVRRILANIAELTREMHGAAGRTEQSQS